MTERALLHELEAVARGATQGPWSELHATSGPMGVVALREPLDASKRVCWLEMPGEHSNAKHISTFDPPTILSLIARVRELEGALERIITYFEADAHDEGAHDEDCADCRELARARAALSAPALSQGGEP